MQVDFHRTRIRLQTPRNKQKFSREIHKETKQKREDGRDHENQQIHGREEASAWDAGCPIPAVRCKCHTIRGWPHQITFLYTREIPGKRDLTLFTSEQRWGQDGSSDKWQSGLEMEGGWGNKSLFISHISYPSENPLGFISALSWPGTPVPFQHPKEEIT